MYHQFRLTRAGFAALSGATALAATTLFGPPAQAQVGSPTGTPIHVVLIKTNGDSRVQGVSATNFGRGDLTVGLPDKVAFVHFDLSIIPTGAVVRSAELMVSFRSDNQGPNQVEVGRVEAGWQEQTITAANQPGVTWKGYARTATSGGSAQWDVTGPVKAWLDGSASNYGFALRGDGPLKMAYSRETAPSVTEKPTLRIKYTRP